MAAKEMYDYFSAFATPDYGANQVASTYFLSLTSHEVIAEMGDKKIVIHIADDGSEERIVIGGTDPVFFVSINYASLATADSGIIMDFYFNPDKGNGIERSFKWVHPSDGHTYVVKFVQSLPRNLNVWEHSLQNIRLKVMGKIED